VSIKKIRAKKRNVGGLKGGAHGTKDYQKGREAGIAESAGSTYGSPVGGDCKR